MNYKETLAYLFSQLPMFQRIGAAAYKANLDNTIAICNLLHNPQNAFKSIHVAGTNGKGSTSHMLASILQEQGYKVGLYTSPHLKDFRERIKINGKMIARKYVVNFVEQHKSNFEKIKPSFFEMTVGLAFSYFAEKKVDIAIIEVGLGGRLDSTNVITPLVSVITNISFDHVALLGDTLEKIASEKAGIIKSRIPVVIGETNIKTKRVFISKANQEKSSIFFADQYYKCIRPRNKFIGSNVVLEIDVVGKEKSFKALQTPLSGHYQKKNILTVLKAIDQLNEIGFNISEKSIRKGIYNVVANTGLLGRWQVLNKKPLIIADTGHNVAGIKEVLQQLKHMKYDRLHMVIGMVNDKDISNVLILLPKQANYYFTKASIPRALDEKELMNKANLLKLKGNSYTTVKQAIRDAKQHLKKNDLLFIGGSTFIVAEAV